MLIKIDQLELGLFPNCTNFTVYNKSIGLEIQCHFVINKQLLVSTEQNILTFI